MEQLFATLNFFATGTGLLITAASAALIILIWDWRAALVGLFLVQLGTITLGVQRYGLDTQWAVLELIVMLLMLTMLAMSVVQLEKPRSLHQAGNWVVRFLALILIILAWRVIEVNIPVPIFGPSAVSLFGWLALCALLILGLGDNPFFSTIGLLLWLITAQTMLAVLIPSPNLFALIGSVEILVTLACSYLILFDRVPGSDRRPVMTDMVFPEEGQMTDGDAVNGYAASDVDMAVDALPLPRFIQQMVEEAEASAARNQSTGAVKRPSSRPATPAVAPQDRGQ